MARRTVQTRLEPERTGLEGVKYGEQRSLRSGYKYFAATADLSARSRQSPQRMESRPLNMKVARRVYAKEGGIWRTRKSQLARRTVQTRLEPERTGLEGVKYGEERVFNA